MVQQRNLVRLIVYAALIVAAVPSVAAAQAQRCARPDDALRPVPDLPSTDQPRRVVPIGGYTLAITWSPQFCREKAVSAAAQVQCAGGAKFGFSLHGLWPDGTGNVWPQYCKSTHLLSPAAVAGMLCATPSVQLVQHEWAKHGTCTGMTSAAYFAKSRGLYAALRYPAMNQLWRRPLTVGQFRAAFAAANAALPASSIRVTARGGWLEEVWICLDTRFSYTPCRIKSGGAASNVHLRIWRGGTR